MGDELTVDTVLTMIEDEAQWCRENGEPDMRYILQLAQGIRDKMAKGMSRDEIMAAYAREDEED